MSGAWKPASKAGVADQIVGNPLLSVENLSTHFRTRRGLVKAVDGIDLQIREGEILALLGESGCGKSVTSLSLMGLIPPDGSGTVSGRVMFNGVDLCKLDHAQMRKLRGKDISMIFQEPLSSLNPVMTVGRQIAEALICHGVAGKREARDKTVQLLREVGISDPDSRFDTYPHELSGGMCQRVMIAMAIACDPKLLIADEPTTALDVTIQKQILNLIHALRERRNTAVLLITHDLGVVAEHADRVSVMYAGKVIEEAPVDVLFSAPAHPYTRGLLDSTPHLEHQGDHLPSIPGYVPDLVDLPAGCTFAPRCAYADERCREQSPGRTVLSDVQSVRCWKPLTQVKVAA